MKKNLLLVFIILTAAVSIFGENMINESDIPMPEIQYELPETLIGEFIIVDPVSRIEITIFPNNKYIVLDDIPNHFLIEYSYGYIIRESEIWYFSPALGRKGRIFPGITEIHLTDYGFLYYEEPDRRLWRAIQKEKMPVPEQLAEDITVSDRIVKQQYFCFSGSETDKIDFNLIETPPGYPPLFHYLQINNGIVRITQDTANRGQPIWFDGFIEITEECADFIKGIIKFTNGVPYYYIEDGTAEIKINSDSSIIITMFYSPSPDLFKLIEIPSKFQFPAKLILEF